MGDRLRWGILGTGNIARQFCTGIKSSRRCSLAAVGSRTAIAAREFADHFDIPTAHATYEALIHDPSVDAVYISLPNSLHHSWTLAALRAGKHILCEKPIASNAHEAREMFDAARRSGKLLVEAFMYRSHPLTLAVLETIKRGEIGKVNLIRTSFCYRTWRIDGNIRFDRELAGGALMDIGCYCIDFSRLVAGQEPTTCSAAGHVHPHGVDDLVVATMSFPNGILASFTCGMQTQADNTAYVCGTDGYIEIPIPWKPPATDALFTIARGTPPRMDLQKNAPAGPPPRQTHRISAGMDLYGVEADDFAAAVLDHVPPHLSAEDSIGNMRILDEMRRQVGVVFPGSSADRR
ncbi:MAG: Gfo/Idh/MocA family oxidoreductase [Phycisphaerales bacterium]|nr:Gfo/Idh/MocA family oxidoreductase [Phycisphaerales bacterium]